MLLRSLRGFGWKTINLCPMIINMKKVSASDSELVDPKLYEPLIISLMYLVNTKLDPCFAVSTFS
jgi:hypothetical protein